MYKLLKKISDTRSFDFFQNFLVRIDSDSRNYMIYDSNLELINSIDGEYEGIMINRNLLLDHSLRGWDFEKNIEFNLENHHLAYADEETLISKIVDYEKRKVSYFLVDLENCKPGRSLSLAGNPVLRVKDLVICRKNNISAYFLIDDTIKWNFNATDIATYIDYDGIHQGEIKEIYSFNKQLIVTVTRGLLSLNIEDGNVLWHVKVEDFNPSSIHIANQKAYLAQGIYYVVVDLKTGEKILDTTLGEHVKVGNEIIPSISSKPDIVYDDNRIWHLDSHEGRYYLFAHEPDTAHIIETQLLEELTVPCHTPRFYQDKMYILDSHNVLYIYE